MSRCVCGGKLRLGSDPCCPNLYYVMCSNPWHEFDPEFLGEALDPEMLQKIEGDRLLLMSADIQEFIVGPAPDLQADVESGLAKIDETLARLFGFRSGIDGDPIS